MASAVVEPKIDAHPYRVGVKRWVSYGNVTGVGSGLQSINTQMKAANSKFTDFVTVSGVAVRYSQPTPPGTPRDGFEVVVTSTAWERIPLASITSTAPVASAPLYQVDEHVWAGSFMEAINLGRPNPSPAHAGTILVRTEDVIADATWSVTMWGWLTEESRATPDQWRP